jgi:hypothetical protein
VDIAFVPDGDEGDTLVLRTPRRKVNKVSDEDGRPKNALHPEYRPESEAAADPSQDTNPFSKQKMGAERLSDDAQPPALEAADIKLPDLDRTISVSSFDNVKQPALYESHPPLSKMRRREGDGEGRDTLMPDQ